VGEQNVVWGERVGDNVVWGEALRDYQVVWPAIDRRSRER
jgi:hypothetical protein